MHYSQAGREFHILLVEDNPGDARLAKEALREGDLDSRLSVVVDGVEALAFLRREPGFEHVDRPDLILLDLNLPRKDGRQVLQEIKSCPDLRKIPVVVLTTSQAEVDISKAYDLLANCYIAKPVDLDAFIDVIKAIEQYWCKVVCLPIR